MRNEIEAYALGGVGLVKGLYEAFSELPAGDRAWIGVIGSIGVYEALAPSGELLSESADRMITKHPIATRAVIGYTALHLMNLLPKQVDLFHRLSKTFD